MIFLHNEPIILQPEGSGACALSQNYVGSAQVAENLEVNMSLLAGSKVWEQGQLLLDVMHAQSLACTSGPHVVKT